MATALICFASASLLAYTWTTVVHLDVAYRVSPIVTGLIIVAPSIGLAIWKPFWLAYLLFFCIPLFGNHPGGRLMEVINIPLAAGTIGLVLRARREALAPPSGTLWWCVGLYIFSALLAFIAAIPGVLVQWIAIGQPSAAIAEALTAPENNPLYSLGSLVMVILAASWAFALVWTRPGLTFARMAFAWVAAAFFLVVFAGALDLHGLITLQNIYQNRIDPRTYDPGTFQSIFWNPGWFAWYFTMAFGTTVGLMYLAPKPWRWMFGVGLAISYFYFLANPQRGGFIALNASLIALAAIAVKRSGWRPSTRLVATIVAVIAVVSVLSVPYVSRGQSAWLSSLRRFSSSDTLVAKSNTERMKVYGVALRMWQSAPVFGIGESAFSWRYREFVTNPAEADTRSTGDAHSTWLQFLATRGLVGLVAYLLVLIATGQLLSRVWRSSDVERRSLGVGLSVALLAFVVYSFVQAMFYMQGIQVFFWGLVGMAAIISPSTAESTSVVASGSSRARTIVALMVVLVALQVWGTRTLFSQAIARIAPGRPYLETLVSTLHLRAAPLEPRDGFLGWEEEPDGRPFRWIDRIATFSVPPQTARIEIPLRLLRFEQKPVEVSVAIEGREVNNVRLDHENWIQLSQWLPRGGSASWTRIQLRVKGAWSPVKVGDIRMVPAAGSR